MCGHNIDQKYRQRAFKAYPEDRELSWNAKPRPRENQKGRRRKNSDDDYRMEPEEWSDGNASPGWGQGAFAGDY
jgi:hypothetical protein